MKRLPVNPADNLSPEALAKFLGDCRDEAKRRGHAQLVSISMTVEDLDPLAVLESIFEPSELHFYAERPASGYAVAGAEAVVRLVAQGSGRFAEARRFMAETLDHALVVGAAELPFAGPHFFVGAAFSPDPVAGSAFPALQLFVPRWQVARMGDDSVAVANLLVAPDAPVEALAMKVWKAHGKFRSFDYRSAKVAERPTRVVRRSELGNAYKAGVARGLSEISSGRYEKVVLARALRFEADRSFHPLGVLNHLRQRFPSCYSFTVGNGAGASFIGASPERLVRVVAGRMHTEALAGSAARGATASEDARLGRELLSDEKELREHQLVLQAIRAQAASLGLTPECPAQPRIVGLANVQHLHTPVSAVLPSGMQIIDLVEALHPTPAVGGAPRAQALEAIARIEAFPRGLYAGPIGWSNWKGEGEFFVGLRSALVEGSEATAYAGAGIVAGSEPEREFQETELKFKALLDVLVGPKMGGKGK